MGSPVNIISPSTETEVRKTVVENFVLGIVCLFCVVMLGFTMYLFFGMMYWIIKDMSSPPVKIVSPSTEMELRRILVENFLFWVGCCCLSVILLYSAILYLADMYLGEDLMFLAFILMLFTSMGAIYNGVLARYIGDGKGERVCRWCTNKFVVKFLMLHYFTRSRAKRVVQAIELQLQLAMDEELVLHSV